MKQNRPQLARIQFIDRKIQGNTYPNATSLAREYEVNSRTIRRDIEYMRDSLGCPIEFDRKKNGFYYTEPSFSLPAVRISKSELFALCVAEKALEQYRATPLYPKLSSIFNKLVSTLPDELETAYTWFTPDITFMTRSRTSIQPEIWETISGSLNSCNVLRIDHMKAGDTHAKTRDVEPCHMVSYEGDWYLIAFCRLRKRVLTFAISRISSAEKLKESFPGKKDFSVNEYLGDHFGITIGGESHDVEIEFSADSAPYIREREWHENQEIRENQDGSLAIAFTTNSLQEVKRWVLGWGSSARVIRPEQLRREIVEELTRTLETY